MSSGLGPPGTRLKYFSSIGIASAAFTSPTTETTMFDADVVLLVEVHGLGGGDLADFARPADAAAAVGMRHVGRGEELLEEAADRGRSRCACGALR